MTDKGGAEGGLVTNETGLRVETELTLFLHPAKLFALMRTCTAAAKVG